MAIAKKTTVKKVVSTRQPQCHILQGSDMKFRIYFKGTNILADDRAWSSRLKLERESNQKGFKLVPPRKKFLGIF